MRLTVERHLGAACGAGKHGTPCGSRHSASRPEFAWGDLVLRSVVGRGDGFGGSATDAMFAVGTEVAAVIGRVTWRIAPERGPQFAIRAVVFAFSATLLLNRSVPAFASACGQAPRTGGNFG
jgi:hypothetical protein